MRFRRFLKRLQDAGLDGYLVSRLSHLHYLFAFRATAGMAFVHDGRAHLIVDPRYVEQAQSEAVGCEVVLAAESLEKTLRELLEKRLRPGGNPVIGVESELISHDLWTRLESWDTAFQWRPGDDLVAQLRQVKEGAEIAAIRKAYRRAQRAFAQARPEMRPGLSEIEIAGLIEHALRRQGAEGYAFETIVAAGPRSALPHALPSRRAWRENEPLLIDYGLRLGGYHSDLTRVLLPPRGRGEAEVAALVDQARRQALGEIRPGVGAKQVDAAARDHIAEAGYGDYFGHSLGHGLGLDVHELPRISKTSEAVLEEGMVFTVEPGIYLPGRFGIRLEDAVVVTRDGYDFLSDPAL